MLELVSKNISNHPETMPAKGTVLLVEDEEDLRTLLAYHLKKDNFKVIPAENGAVAMNLVAGEIPDIILLDIMLPVLDGWEVCRKIRKHPDTEISSIPIIMVTALQDKRDKYKGLNLGADLFIHKPYSYKELLIYCNNFIQAKKKQQTLLNNPHNRDNGNKNIFQLLAHEMKNHLMVIDGLSELLSKSNRLVEKDRQLVKSINKSADYLGILTRNLDLFTQLEQHMYGSYSEAFTLSGLTNDLIESLHFRYEEKRIRIEPVDPENDRPVRTNKTAVMIVLAIVLENAYKYTPANGSVSVHFAHTSNSFTVMISDNGPGLSNSDKILVFDKYYRSPNAKQKQPGSGLGLYYAKLLTEEMNGTITVEDAQGNGSCFVIAIPNQLSQN